MAHPAARYAEHDPAQEARAEQFVLHLLRDAHEPLSAESILEAGQKKPTEPIPYSMLRNVIWSLVGRGLVQVTTDWRVILAR